MSVTSAIRKMVMAGFTLEQAVTAAAIFEDETAEHVVDPTTEKRRAWDRERKRAIRARPVESGGNPVDNMSGGNPVDTNNCPVESPVDNSPSPSPQEIYNQPPIPIPDYRASPSPKMDFGECEKKHLNGKRNDAIVDWFLDGWNGFARATGLPTTRAITDARRKHILARANDLTEALDFETPQAGFQELFAKIRAGASSRPQRARMAGRHRLGDERNQLSEGDGGKI